VSAVVRPGNRPSQGVARKFGMRVERQAIFHALLHDLYVWTGSKVTDAGSPR
jgi:RimJ/RimL family protein N-acetyltransferase